MLLSGLSLWPPWSRGCFQEPPPPLSSQFPHLCSKITKESKRIPSPSSFIFWGVGSSAPTSRKAKPTTFAPPSPAPSISTPSSLTPVAVSAPVIFASTPPFAYAFVFAYASALMPAKSSLWVGQVKQAAQKRKQAISKGCSSPALPSSYKWLEEDSPAPVPSSSRLARASLAGSFLEVEPLAVGIDISSSEDNGSSSSLDSGHLVDPWPHSKALHIPSSPKEVTLNYNFFIGSPTFPSFSSSSALVVHSTAPEPTGFAPVVSYPLYMSSTPLSPSPPSPIVSTTIVVTIFAPTPDSIPKV